MEESDVKKEFKDVENNSNIAPAETPTSIGPSPPGQITNIVDLFDNYKADVVQQNDGSFKTECPHCGLQSNRTLGFILFPDSGQLGRAFCHKSGKNFDFLETYALLNKIIACNDGRSSGEKKYVLQGDLFTQTIDHFKNQYTESTFINIADKMGLRTEIEIPGNNRLVSAFAHDAGEVIGKKNVIFFRPETHKIIEINKILHVNHAETKYDGFRIVSNGRFVTILERFFRPWTTLYTKQGEMKVYKSLPQSQAGVVMESDNFIHQIPIINRLFTVPLPIIYNGELTSPNPGYDVRFGSYMPYNSPKIRHDMPLYEAKELFDFILREFCFKDKEKDFIKALAGLLTPFIRGLFPTFNTRTPVFIYEANRERSGKDYLAGLRGILYEGVALEEPPVCTGEVKGADQNAELRKKILAALMEGRKLLHFANNRGVMKNAVFEGFITSAVFSDRKLSTNDTISIPNETDLSMSSNEMDMTADMMNRSIFVTLFLEIEDANKREFDTPDLHGWVLAHREDVLSAAFSLVKNWFDAGQPKGSVPFSSFPTWADIMGGILEAAGYKHSPCERELTREGISDSETGDIKRLFELCFEQLPDQWVSRNDIKKVVENTHKSEQETGVEPEYLFSYLDLDDRGGITQFWKKINKYAGRVFSKIRLRHDGNERPARRKFKFEPEKSGQKSPKNGPKNGSNDGQSGNVGNVGKGEPIEKFSIRESNQGVPPSQRYQPYQNEPKTSESIKKTDEKHSESIKKTSQTIKTEGLKKRAEPEKNLVKPKVGTDREVQYYDPECWDTRNVKTECSKDEVLEYIKTNPGVETKGLLDQFGTGSFNHLAELKRDNIIKEEDYHLFVQ